MHGSGLSRLPAFVAEGELKVGAELAGSAHIPEQVAAGL